MVITLNYIVWNVKPEIFSVGPITLRWYGLLWGLAIYAAFLVVIRIFKNENRPANWSDKMFFYGSRYTRVPGVNLPSFNVPVHWASRV